MQYHLVVEFAINCRNSDKNPRISLLMMSLLIVNEGLYLKSHLASVVDVFDKPQ